jgi:hypothetical protein
VRIPVAAFVSAVLLTACAAGLPDQREPAQRSVRPAEEFTLEVGGAVWLEGTSFLLIFAAVSEDSRCPRDVSCIWEGNARVAFTVREAVPGKKRGTLYEVVDTNLDLNTSGRFEQRRKFLDGYIELRKLDPQPPIEDPKRYVATMKFEGRQ